MKATKENTEIKKPFTTMFPDIVISDDEKRHHDSLANRKKVEKAKKNLSNFNFR